MKNNKWKYSERNSSDTFEDVVDLDTGEQQMEVKNPPKNKTAVKLMNIFSQMCEEKIKVRPVMAKGNYFITLQAMKHLEPTQIVELMDLWFQNGKEKEDLIQITQCLSVNNINRFKTKIK